MRNNLLEHAREKAESIRFSAEQTRNVQPDDDTVTDEASGKSALHDLEIVPGLVPSIARVLADSRNRLEIPADAVQAFVYSSSEIQAYCITKSREKCVLRFSSALINLLTEEELSFVVGHELGHFLLRHGNTISGSTLAGPYLRSSRYQEISSDRLGLIACQSFDTAARALMKLTSGLSDAYLTFDIELFLEQIRESLPDMKHLHSATTHPPMLVRARALLWFSECMSQSHQDTLPDSQTMASLDKRVREIVDFYISEQEAIEAESISQVKTSLRIWITAEKVCEDGRVNEQEKIKIAVLLGKEKARSLISFLKTFTSIGEVQSAIAMKKTRAIAKYEEVTGERADKLMSRIQEEIEHTLT